MTVALAAVLAFATPPTTVPFESTLTPPTARYPGAVTAPPYEHWEHALPGRPLNAATHSERARPVVIDEGVLVGSAGGRGLYLVSRRDGSLIRTFPAQASVESEPVVSEGRVYFADTAGFAWAYTLEGEKLWSRDTGAPVLSRPTVANGRVYVANVDDLAVALDASTGELVWRYKRRPDLTRRTDLSLYASPPAEVLEDAVVFGFADGFVVALHPARGDVLWEQRVGEGAYPDVVAAAVRYGDDLFASGYFEPLAAIDLRTHEVRWRVEGVGAASSPIVVEREGVGLLVHPGSDGRLRAIDTRSGDVLWTWESETGGALTTPVTTPAGLFVGSSEGGIWLLDLDTGLERWRWHGTWQLEGLSAAPAVDGRQVLFTTNAGELYSMLSPRPSRGKMRWGEATPLFRSPAAEPAAAAEPTPAAEPAEPTPAVEAAP